LHAYARLGELVVARWPPLPESRSYGYAWDPGLETRVREAEAIGTETQVRSVPLAVFVTTSDEARHLPLGWPNPTVCATAKELLELLRES
jgi:hypothetical protein